MVVNVFADDTKPRLEDELAPADNLTAKEKTTAEDITCAPTLITYIESR